MDFANKDNQAKQHKINELTADNTQFKKICTKKQEELAQYKDRIEKFESDIEELTKFVEDCDQKLHQTQQAKEQMMGEIENLSIERDQLQ